MTSRHLDEWHNSNVGKQGGRREDQEEATQAVLFRYSGSEIVGEEEFFKAELDIWLSIFPRSTICIHSWVVHHCFPDWIGVTATRKTQRARVKIQNGLTGEVFTRYWWECLSWLWAGSLNHTSSVFGSTSGGQRSRSLNQELLKCMEIWRKRWLSINHWAPRFLWRAHCGQWPSTWSSHWSHGIVVISTTMQSMRNHLVSCSEGRRYPHLPTLHHHHMVPHLFNIPSHHQRTEVGSPGSAYHSHF